MCPIASLFVLIEGPCKSMWNSPAEADLFSSAILTCVCFDCIFLELLGGLSLHLNHLIASRLANYD